MKDLRFIRIDTENINLLPNNIEINKERFLGTELKEFIENNKNYIFIGMIENEVIAVLYGYGIDRPDGKKMFYIHSVDVSEKYQQQGIGTKLMDYVLNYIKQEKIYYKFFVLADENNTSACKLYEKYADSELQILYSAYLYDLN